MTGQSKDLESKDPESKDPETKDQETKDPETTDPETTDPESKDPESKDPETKDPETKDQETKDPETKDPETTDPETTDPETTDPESKDPETKDPETKDPETKDPETTDPETKDPETKDPETKDPETTDPESKDPETKDPETKDPETTDPETTDPETTDPETKDPETKDLETKNPKNKDPEATDPETKDPESLDLPAAQMTKRKKLKDSNQVEEPKDTSDDDSDEEEENRDMEEEEEMSPSALLEQSTLLWSGNLNKKILLEQKDGGSEKREMEEGGQETDKSRWRESMPEGERWRDEDLKEPLDYKEDCWLADDEEDEDEDKQKDMESMSVKPAMGFTPHVTILNRNPNPEDIRGFPEKEAEIPAELGCEEPFYQEEWEENDKVYLCEHVDREKMGFVFSTLAGGLLFPLLVWGGYALLPFDSPVLRSAPLRVTYTLHCAFFAIVPIVLGVVVKGVARLQHCAMKPLYLNGQVDREVMVHGHFVSESLALFLFYFLQLAVLATYISQDLVKLVPLLTIIFVFGRLIYWLCLVLGSSFRGLGFAFSFFPMLVMLGANLYYLCSSVGQEAVFDVAVPTTPPPPKLRWWF